MTSEIAEKAGEIDELHFADALVYATSQALRAFVVTCDPHFKGLHDAEMI